MNAPTLTDDRIEAMRLEVMDGVTTDVRRRARRTRWTGGLAAAALVVVAIGGGANLLSRPDTGSEISASGAASDASENGAAAPDNLKQPNEVAPVEPDRASPPPERQVVRTGSVLLVVDDPRGEADDIVTFIEKAGGRVDQRSESGDGDDASASLTVRVPSDQVTKVVDYLKRSSDVEDVSLSNDDVTSTVVDLDARIKALNISIDRLSKILADARSSAEVVSAESALTQRQTQLEGLLSQRKVLGDQVSMASLEISLNQDEQSDSVDPDGFTGGLQRGWNALVNAVNGVVETTGAALPWAGVLLITFGAYRVVRRVRRQRVGTR